MTAAAQVKHTDIFPADSRRGHERLMAYWQQIKGKRKFPQAKEIDTKAIADLWSSCFLVNTQSGDGIYKYDFMGPSLIEAYGIDLTGQAHGGATEPHIQSMLDSFARVVKNGEQIMDESEFTNKQNMRIKYRCCLVPFGEAPDKVNYILGLMRWIVE